MILTETRERVSERGRTIPPSGIRRFFEIAATMQDVISLGIGEPNFVSPKPIIDAAVDSLVNKGMTNYTANLGMLELRELLAAQLQDLYGVKYDPTSEIVMTVGGSEAMQLAMMAILDPGDEILIPEPCFVSYGPTAQFAGAKVVYVPTSVENAFQVTAADLEARITPKTKAVFLGYPSNPTGAVLTQENVQEIAKLLIEKDLLLISDEIYSQLIYGETAKRGHICMASVEGLWERTILLGGFSKNYAMTGWRLGYACAPKDILTAMYKIHQYMIMSAPTPSQMGAIAALKYCDDDVERMRVSYDERRRYIVDGFRAAGLPTFEPEGAFYCFPDIRSTGLTSEEFAQKLLMEEHVACVPGDAFGPSGAGYMRCSYATSMDKVQEAVTRIARFAQKYQALAK
jgi:aminotransferase